MVQQRDRVDATLKIPKSILSETATVLKKNQEIKNNSLHYGGDPGFSFAHDIL